MRQERNEKGHKINSGGLKCTSRWKMETNCMMRCVWKFLHLIPSPALSKIESRSEQTKRNEKGLFDIKSWAGRCEKIFVYCSTFTIFVSFFLASSPLHNCTKHHHRSTQQWTNLINNENNLNLISPSASSFCWSTDSCKASWCVINGWNNWRNQVGKPNFNLSMSIWSSFWLFNFLRVSTHPVSCAGNNCDPIQFRIDFLASQLAADEPSSICATLVWSGRDVSFAVRVFCIILQHVQHHHLQNDFLISTKNFFGSFFFVDGTSRIKKTFFRSHASWKDEKLCVLVNQMLRLETHLAGIH